MTTYVVTMNDITPPVRYDGNPWIEIIFQESASQTGTFDIIDTISLSTLPGGLDADPSEPSSRNLTITNATVPAGWYSFIFQDAAANQSQATNPIQNAPSVEDSIRPSLDNLGALLHVRTTIPGTGGTELGTFTSVTRPTATEAQSLIDNAVNQVLLTTGPGVASSLWSQARTVVLYLAAMLVELSFYKNEIAKDISAYPMYETQYSLSLDGLMNSITDDTPGSAVQSFFTVPIMNKAQANFQYLLNAVDPVTGMINPALLPPDLNWPMGIGGLPLTFYEAVNAWPGMIYETQGSADFLQDY
jgi:hypothetical protein